MNDTKKDMNIDKNPKWSTLNEGSFKATINAMLNSIEKIDKAIINIEQGVSLLTSIANRINSYKITSSGAPLNQKKGFKL